ncbi:MAG TPA: hypothetical protein VKR60_13090, partial [Candidatus Sulfotelmatobacter sp.]|nr:hypothetical protein [Candidatus Sulfotelmatobacter sp.]
MESQQSAEAGRIQGNGDKGSRQRRHKIQEAESLTVSTGHLIAPHGGELAELTVQPERAAEL